MEIVKMIKKLITQTNRTQMANKKNEWLVIHYVGAVSTAENNAVYFSKEYRGASAHYFVDEKSIWQAVEDKDSAWHVGAKKYYTDCRNENSIGIEMCCKKTADGQWYFEEQTVENTIELASMIAEKYQIPMERIIRHKDATGKNCPEPYVRNPEAWADFKKRIESRRNEMRYLDENLTEEEKYKAIMDYYGFEEQTIRFLTLYKWGEALIEKLYRKTKK